MRHRVFLLIVGLTLLAASPAWALLADEFALAPQGGMATMTGKLGGLFAADFAYGAGVAYGLTDLLGLEADFLYSLHEELDRDETGRLNLTQFITGFGPRLNWNTDHLVPYVGLLAAASFLRYKARWKAGGEQLRDEDNAHGFGGMVAFGLDAYVADGFTIGLAGRVGYFGTNLSYTHLDTDDGESGGNMYLSGLLRLTLLF